MDGNDRTNALLRRQADTVEFRGALFCRGRQFDAFNGADFRETLAAEDYLGRHLMSWPAKS
jgi:hypothetical protein